jgi:hypothetical protein
MYWRYSTGDTGVEGGGLVGRLWQSDPGRLLPSMQFTLFQPQTKAPLTNKGTKMSLSGCWLLLRCWVRSFSPTISLCRVVGRPTAALGTPPTGKIAGLGPYLFVP